jgi:hypothetical protein
MSNDYINATALARRAGLDRRHAKAATWHSGASFHHNGTRVLTEEQAQKIAARSRFAQRSRKRQDKRNVKIADAMRPRVVIDMGADRG